MVSVAILLPELLGTYGDVGNALVVAQRARRRGVAVELLEVCVGDAVPPADLYLLGGGEDGPQRLACDLLAASSFPERVADGAHVVAVCAGLQLLGQTFAVEGADEYPGLGLVNARTYRGTRRSVGDLAVSVAGQWLVGFENHGGRTVLDANLPGLGTVARGRGNDGQTDGLRVGNIRATYAHGPVFALNPWFCDEVLADVLGRDLEPLAGVADRLYEERCRTLTLRRPG